MLDQKLIYFFGNGKADGDASLKNLLGGKGANLAEMSKIGIPVPPGFTIPTILCTYFYENNCSLPDELYDEIKTYIKKIEDTVGKVFGSETDPLLVSVRSGARISMPGMMDTVLNLGLNDKTVTGLANSTNDLRFALDSYRRFIQMYADVVMNIDHFLFENVIDDIKEEKDIDLDTDLSSDDLQLIIDEYKKIVYSKTNKEFPQDVYEQLHGAIKSVFISWQNDRAKIYRKINNIADNWGTAVTVQSMVFGNMGEDSATGVAFTRNPSDGVKEIYGEYLPNAQGEDVVAGIRTPLSLVDVDDENSLYNVMPNIFKELENYFSVLENHYRDMQDIEFTVQQGKLWILQTRSGKRTAKASIKIAVDLVEEEKISKEDAISLINPYSLDQLLHPTIDPNSKKNIIAKGLPASPGAAYGKVVFDPDVAQKEFEMGEKVILVRNETSPEDIHGMHSSQAIITARGGMTSHAAVVARGMGKPCVCGIKNLSIKQDQNYFLVGNVKVSAGDFITVDGSKGDIILGSVKTLPPSIDDNFKKIMKWADETKKLGVRTNAEVEEDVKTAFDFNAEGIGLCRTEHMFFEKERINYVREMILAKNKEERKSALAKILNYQVSDFEKIFKITKEKPVTIRLLDPPLHEFLPQNEAEISELVKQMGVDKEEIMKKISSLHESNPMLGHRGCRLGITALEIYEMQVKAIVIAAHNISENENVTPKVEIMIPLISLEKEIEYLKTHLCNAIENICTKEKFAFEYLFGTMIELPRAALCADDIAKHADFFSFGTNDLTQTTFGISRDDAGSFLTEYLNNNIIANDPFTSLDIDGVGKLLEIGVKLGRTTNHNLKIGICGEHGGDPASIEFAHKIGLDYVSCSPFRVPIAKIAAAKAHISASKAQTSKEDKK